MKEGTLVLYDIAEGSKPEGIWLPAVVVFVHHDGRLDVAYRYGGVLDVIGVVSPAHIKRRA